jgi:large subunit ribosomal protein L20
MRGARYSELMAGLLNAGVELDRKSLSEIAIHDPDTFTKIVELAKQHQKV